jgi:hypothetical protein
MLMQNSTKYELKSLIPIYYGTVYIYINIKNIFILTAETSFRKNRKNVYYSLIFSSNLFIYSNIQ